jgi:hypothetical protein
VSPLGFLSFFLARPLIKASIFSSNFVSKRVALGSSGDRKRNLRSFLISTISMGGVGAFCPYALDFTSKN